jgi:D-aspartate ligase
MKFLKHHTPVVVINCKLGALAIMRSLGPLGVPLCGVDSDPRSPAMLSRYCRKKRVTAFDPIHPEPILDELIHLAKEEKERPILIPTSDETAVFVAEHGDRLGEYYLFPRNSPETMRQLISKKSMFELALKHQVPTPRTIFPRNMEDVESYLNQAVFPVMLKGILGNLLEARTGKKMVLVNSPEELLVNYRLLENPESPNLMFQEYIPGGDDQIFIYNGYFDGRSDALVSYTGYKLRQFPVHVGCASLGECLWNQKVSDLTTRFMKEIGYRGILDIGYRLDPRDGQYKVLDINPRVGQAFRLFVSENDMDVVKSLYLDLTGQKQIPSPPKEGRRWLIEDYDIISSYHYFREGSLTFGQWIKSFKGVEEGAWFSFNDPRPFLEMTMRLVRKGFVWLGKKVFGLRKEK